MNRLRFLTTLLAVFLLFDHTGTCQTEEGSKDQKQESVRYIFPNPETGGDRPTMVKPKVAETEALAKSSVAGFTGAYFDKSAILDLLEPTNAVGIRFYIAMQNPKQRFSDIIAVAINEDGKEVAAFLEKKYRSVPSLDMYYPEDLNKKSHWLPKRVARIHVQNLLNGAAGYKKFTAYYSKSVIYDLFKIDGMTGIRMRPSTEEGTGNTTMNMGPVRVVGNNVEDIVGTDYLRSNLPCPVDCGDTGEYLWE